MADETAYCLMEGGDFVLKILTITLKPLLKINQVTT